MGFVNFIIELLKDPRAAIATDGYSRQNAA